jgi:hypothetical protein
MNYFKMMLKDKDILEKKKNDIFFMATLNALSKYIENGNKINDLPFLLKNQKRLDI